MSTHYGFFASIGCEWWAGKAEKGNHLITFHHETNIWPFVSVTVASTFAKQRMDSGPIFMFSISADLY